MKHCKYILCLYLCLLLGEVWGQTTWNLRYDSNGNAPYPFQTLQPIEWNNYYFIFHRGVSTGTQLVDGRIKKISPTGSLIHELVVDSIGLLTSKDIIGLAVIMDTVASVPRLNLLASILQNGQEVIYRIGFDYGLNIISTDSIVCNQCVNISNLYFGDIVKVNPETYLIVGQRPLVQFSLAKLNFSTGEVKEYLETNGDLYLAISPFKFDLNDTTYYGLTDYYPKILRFFDEDLNPVSRLNERFQALGGGIANSPCQSKALSSYRILQSSIFMGFSFSDTIRVGLLLQDRFGNDLDSFSIPSVQGSWFEFGLMDYLDTNAIFIGASQKTGFKPPIFENAHIEVHKVGLNRQKHWSVSLGRRPGYEILQIKATTDGGVLVYTRYFDQGVWFHELRKLDGQGNFLSQSEFPLQKAFSIYPNPATDYLILQSEQVNAPSTQVRLLDLLGKEVWSAECTQAHYGCKLNLPPLAQGMYQLQLLQENRIVGQEKFILGR